MIKVNLYTSTSMLAGKAQQVGSFCGKKVRALKENVSRVVAAVSSIASKIFKIIQVAALSTKKAIIAVKDCIVSKASKIAARCFNKKQTPNAVAPVVVPVVAPIVAEEAGLQAERENSFLCEVIRKNATAAMNFLARERISEKTRVLGLKIAVRNGQLNIVQALLASGAQLSEDDKSHVVLIAAKKGHLAILRELLKHGAEISEYYRGYAVHNGTKYGHLEIVKELLSKGATISDRDRSAAIDVARNHNYQEILEVLEKKN
jgi:hypothetical protein